jgi:hypothetical protein
MSQFLQDLLERAKKKADSLESSSFETDTVTVSDTVPVSVDLADQYLLLRVYNTINTLQPRLLDGESRVYLFLLHESHGKYPYTRRIEYHQRQLMQAIGMTSPTTLSRSMKGLQKRQLVKWIRKARAKGERSVIEVCLPWERL